MLDYFAKTYGPPKKYFCSAFAEDLIRSKVVRIVGSGSEGSGFFIELNARMVDLMTPFTSGM